MKKHPAILLDLDDTLYEEADYVRSGYRHLGEVFATEAGVPAAAITGFLTGRFEAQGREGAFDALLLEFPVLALKVTVADLVDAYRKHQPTISFYPGAREMLGRLKGRYPVAIVTDGLPLMQRNKVQALGLEQLVDAIVYCWEEDAPKPDPAAYLKALALLGGSAESALIVGDNPAHDELAAKALGCRFVRVLTGRFMDVPSAAVAIADVTRLTAMLEHEAC
ncbi:HAD family hydrolase [Gimibacter soli]|uniref:HAD family hydrolase n=1 Tax=Gimibacter soli TaxID=3024400 RepID=A0AAE9XQ63_9PROT|nr:HAD family hydrolase [Gimibacter soli]WCL53061.1 HAD family hydrolase [Gimibacter soli]